MIFPVDFGSKLVGQGKAFDSSTDGGNLTAAIRSPNAPVHICAAVLSSLNPFRRQTFTPLHPNQAVAIKAVSYGLQRRRIQPSRRAPAAARKAGIGGETSSVFFSLRLRIAAGVESRKVSSIL